MKKTLLLKTMLLLCALVVGTSSSWADNFVINTTNFTKPNSGSGYAAYDGDRSIGGVTITSSNVMINNSSLQFKKSGGNLYNKNAMPGNITKITLASPESFTIYVGTSSSPSTTTVTSGTTISGNYTYFKIINSTSGALSTATITVEYSSTLSVTYNGNGNTSGSVPTDATAYASGATVTVLGNTGSLAKSGYTFGGWNTQADGLGTNYTAGNTFTISANTTLYAKWTAKTITGLSYEGTPTKTTYNAGESFDPTGLTVTATFDDSSSDDVTTSVSWTPDPLTEGTTSVTGTYMGQTVNVSGLTVNAAPGSENNPYTVAEAIAYINTLGTSTSPNDVFVSGIISQVDEYNSSYHSITYWISDDGTTTGQMEVYSGKGLNGADFSALKDLEVGDVVTVKGKVKKYNSTPEFDKNNELVSITGRTKVNISTFTATTPTIVIGESTETTVTNDQAGWTPVSYTYESDDEDVATVDANGVITAVAKGTANITVTANVASEDATYKTGESKSVEITVTNPFHNVIFSVNGVAGDPTSTEEGAAVSFPANPADLGGKKFVGWTATAIDGTTDEAPTFVTSATMGTSDQTYYAVFATGTSSAVTKTDNLTYTLIGVSGTTYTGWEDLSDQSDAVYAGNSAGGNTAIQLRSDKSTSGIVTTTSGGKVKKITVTWNSNTAADRTLDIYGNNTAYTAASNLYAAATRGTKLGSIINGTSTELIVTDDYEYIGLRSNSNAMYFDNIAIEWESGGTTYSGYCTSITVPLTISDAGYATFSNASAVDFSSNAGLIVYYVSSTAGNKAEMVEISSKKVPANTGVLLKGAAGNYSGAVTTGVDALEGNLLFACVDGYDATVDNEIYILANGGSGVGFYPIKGGTSLGAGKAYIGGGDVNAKCLTLSFENETTAINGVEEVAPANVKTRKVVKNGRLVIETANGEFTIDGARVK